MKKILLALLLPCILIAGCTESTLNGPPVISKVELNTDSMHNGGRLGTYKVYLKSNEKDPVFYSYVRYNSGDTLVPISHLQSMMDRKTKSYIDTIESKNRRIYKLESENETMLRQLEEKNLLIRFLTGK